MDSYKPSKLISNVLCSDEFYQSQDLSDLSSQDRRSTVYCAEGIIACSKVTQGERGSVSISNRKSHDDMSICVSGGIDRVLEGR
eukprot:scaffold262193_cov43-Prasinocladus_malaysianus.AAC.1